MSRTEQTSWEEPITRRANRSSTTQKQSTGHQAEDRPYYTTQGQSRKPARIIYTDDEDDDIYTERRMPVVVKKYTQPPVSGANRSAVVVPL